MVLDGSQGAIEMDSTTNQLTLENNTAEQVVLVDGSGDGFVKIGPESITLDGTTNTISVTSSNNLDSVIINGENGTITTTSDITGGGRVYNSFGESIHDNASIIINNANEISQNDSEIATNLNQITANNIDIATNLTQITSNDSDIADNASQIDINEDKITANTSSISDNTTEISSINSDLDSISVDDNVRDMSLDSIIFDGDEGAIEIDSDTNEIRVQNEDGEQVIFIDGSGEGRLKIGKNSVDIGNSDIQVRADNGSGNSVIIEEDDGTIISTGDIKAIGTTTLSADVYNSYGESIGQNATKIAANTTNISNNTINIDKNSRAIARNAALFALKFSPNHQSSVAVGFGNSSGYSAIAAGSFIKPSENVVFNTSVAMTVDSQTDFTYAAGVTFGF